LRRRSALRHSANGIEVAQGTVRQRASRAARSRSERLHGETQAVQSKLLHDALTDFAEDASRAMQAQLAAGAEVPFELQAGGGRLRAGGRGASLQLYSPLTGRFISEHWRMLCGLRSHRLATCTLEAYRGLDRYLSSMRPQGDLRASARSTLATHALRAFLEDVFSEQSDLGLRPSRLQSALARLDAAGCTEAGSVTLLASLHGLALVSAQLPLSQQLTLTRPQALSEVPEQALWLAGHAGEDGDRDPLLVVLEIEEPDGRLDRALAHGRELLRDLLQGLRLYGDGRIALGPLAWASAGEGGFVPVALGLGGRPDGVLIVRPEQEDELRAFCNLVSRRAPHEDALAWAMRRFELGCERDSELEALSDHLLALQALLEPERAAPGLLASRTAVLCAEQADRKRIASRVLRG
jgi:hypothetical protein